MKRDHSNAVSCVEQDRNSLSFQQFDKAFKRHEQAGWACDRIDHCQDRSFTNTRHDEVNHRALLIDWKGDVDRYHNRAPTFSNKIDSVSTGLIGMIGNENFIAFIERQ